MKIVQINAVCGKGSTGHIAVDIANAVELSGDECFIAYGHGTTDYPKSYKIGNKFEHLVHNIIFSRILGLQGYGSILTTYKFTRWLDKIKPDVVHIHNLHANYINQNILYRYLIKRGIPVVFTLHDCLNFTGKCTHYSSAGCNKWQTECSHCPLYKSSGIPSLFFDWSKQMFSTKRSLYNNLRKCITFGVSQWLCNEARKSILNISGNNVNYIYNWIDYNEFAPSDKQEIDSFKKKYNLKSDIKYLVSVSQDWIYGTSRLEDAITLAKKLPKGYKLLLIGRKDSRISLPKNVDHISYISKKKELACVYSLAEAYIHLSTQDTFGLVTGEAMACGTIPITYDCTACAEIPGRYGIKVKPRDIDGIIKSLPLLREKKKHIGEMMEFVKTMYDKNNNVSKYLEAYQSITNCQD